MNATKNCRGESMRNWIMVTIMTKTKKTTTKHENRIRFINSRIPKDSV
jgi:hypothetical protein